MPEEINKAENNEDLSEETMSFNDNCETPVIAQVDTPDNFVNGILVLPDEEEYVDEP